MTNDKNHPYVSTKKERTGWGKWSPIITKHCQITNKDVRIVKNWNGPKPSGAIACPHCGRWISL